MIKNNAAVLSLAMAVAAAGINQSDVQQPQQPKRKVPAPHPFLGKNVKLFVYLLEDETINADDVTNLKKYLSVPVEMIPYKDAFDIVNYINSNRKSSYKNMGVYETDVEILGVLYPARIIATNQKNANRKFLVKLNTINQLLNV